MADPLVQVLERHLCAFLLGFQLEGILQMMEMTMGKEQGGPVPEVKVGRLGMLTVANPP